jgi:hypothetical protein
MGTKGNLEGLMANETFRDDVRRILTEELDKNAMVNMANGIIDDLHSLKTAIYREDRRTVGDVMESLDQRTRILRNKLYQADNI